MRRLLLIVLVCTGCFSCQKGIHWDIASTGFLIKDANNNCLPVSLKGDYVADSLLGADNTLFVDVNVTGAGTYQIYTDTVNGYAFSSAGTFDNTGVHHVQLWGKGKPLVPGTNQIIIHYNSSTCSAAIPVTTNTIPPATYTLQGEPGKCMNSKLLGKYVATHLLDTSNKVEIMLNVLTAGSYDIKTQFINGYSFSASGLFETTGPHTITLTGEGWCENKGVNSFVVTSSASTCSFEVNVMSDEAVFKLNTLAGKCMDYIVSGTFVKDIYLDTMSRVVISVDVTSPGRYNIHTLLINGYSFMAAGTFLSAGVQRLTLFAQGKPVYAGSDVFLVSAGSSNCTFEVAVLPDIVRVSGSDYLPLADSNYWVYDDLFYKGNVITRTINGTQDKNGKHYFNIDQADILGLKDSFLVRRDDDVYLEYARKDKYTTSFSFAINKPVDLLFLKQQLQQGQSWESAEYRDISSFNQPITLKYGYTVKRANAVIAVNGKAFADVAIIEQTSQLHSDGNAWGATHDVYTYYYAKGIGLIYLKRVSNNFTAVEMGIKSWKVN